MGSHHHHLPTLPCYTKHGEGVGRKAGGERVKEGIEKESRKTRKKKKKDGKEQNKTKKKQQHTKKKRKKRGGGVS